MNLSTEEFIHFYENSIHLKASQIGPICVSPFTSNNKSLQIQVITTPKQNSEIKNSDYPLCKIIKDSNLDNCHDKNCFYQISSQQLMTLVQKISQNKCEWNIPAFFPAKFVTASLSGKLLFVGLSDKTINILDTDTGVCCFPSLFVDDTIIFLLSEDNFVICFTSNNMLMIWEIVNNKYLRSVIHEKYDGPELGKIQKVILTNELENDSMSPIIFAENITVRFSKTRNGWININPNIPSIFGKRVGFRTIFDVEKGFFESFINHEVENSKNCMAILLRKYLSSKRFNNVIRLVIQLLDIIGKGKKVYCGMDPKDLLEYMLNIIKEANPDLVQRIKTSQEYKDAFNPKPKLPPQQPVEIEHVAQQKVQPIITQPSNTNITKEQQNVINLINNSPPFQLPSSIITQPNISTSPQSQNETFVWTMPTQQNQPKETPNQAQSSNIPTNAPNIVNNTPQAISNIEQQNETNNNNNNSSNTADSNNENDLTTQNDNQIPIPVIPLISNQLSSTLSENTEKISSPVSVHPSTTTSSPKHIVNGQSKSPQKRALKQGTLTDFLQIQSDKKVKFQAQSENQSTPKNIRKKSPQKAKAKASPNKKNANTQQQEQQPKEEETENIQIQKTDQTTQNEQTQQIAQNQEQEDSQQKTQTPNRRSPRVKKAAIADSPEPKAKARQTPKKKGKGKATEIETEEKGEENQEIQQPTEIKKAKTTRKTTKRSPSKAKSNQKASEADNENSQQQLPQIENTSNQPPVTPSQINIVPQDDQQQSQKFVFLNDNLPNMNQIANLSQPVANSSNEVKQTKKSTPKRKQKQNTPSGPQTPIIPQISQTNQPAQIPMSFLTVNGIFAIPQQLQPAPQVAVQPEVKPKTPRKTSTPRKKTQKAAQSEAAPNQQTENGNTIVNPQITSTTTIGILDNNPQENQENIPATPKATKTTRTRAKKATTKTQETDATNQNEQAENKPPQEKKKRGPYKKKNKVDPKAISNEPINQIINNDETPAPITNSDTKLTIQDAEKSAEKMQQENQ